MKRLVVMIWLIPCFGSQAYSQAAKEEQSGTAGRRAAITVPAGTRILMTLSSPLHTTSAQSGSGVYLETSWPVVQDDTVVIPPHSRVLGVVEQERRPGRGKGRAQFRFRFTSLILPDNQVASITGRLEGLPGDPKNRVQNTEGTIEPVGQIDRDVYTVSKGAAAGGLAGALSGGGVGAGIGAAVGGGLGLAKAVFSRGDEIGLGVGTKVEMILQRPLVIGIQ